MAPTSSGASGRAGAALDCLVVLAVLYGSRLAARALGLTSYSGYLTIVLVVTFATWLLRRRGASWRSVGFARPPHLGIAAAWTIGTSMVLLVILPAILEHVAQALALPPQDFSRFGDIKGDTWRYLVLLIPIGWGTAAFGEELVYRGFLNTRLAAALGGGHGAIALAAVGQALLFGLVHAYLGPRGVMNASAIGLVSSAVYLACGRNLWPIIIAHGLVDTVGLTVLHLGIPHAG